MVWEGNFRRGIGSRGLGRQGGGSLRTRICSGDGNLCGEEMGGGWGYWNWGWVLVGERNLKSGWGGWERGIGIGGGCWWGRGIESGGGGGDRNWKWGLRGWWGIGSGRGGGGGNWKRGCGVGGGGQ